MAPTPSDNNLNLNPTSSATPAESTTQQEQQTPSKQPLALPAAPSAGEAAQAQKLDLSAEGGGQITLDHLGPMVVNQDGTLSRISNWDKMTEIERKNTLRVLGKRNRERMDKLKGGAEGKA